MKFTQWRVADSTAAGERNPAMENMLPCGIVEY